MGDMRCYNHHCIHILESSAYSWPRLKPFKNLSLVPEFKHAQFIGIGVGVVAENENLLADLYFFPAYKSPDIVWLSFYNIFIIAIFNTAEIIVFINIDNLPVLQGFGRILYNNLLPSQLS